MDRDLSAMKFHPCCLLLAVALPAFAHSENVCPAAKESVLVNIPGYEPESNAGRPKAVTALEQCMKQYPICLLLKDGKVVGGAGEAQVRVVRESVVFAFVQHLRTRSRSYCAFASLQPDVGGEASWSYRTFTPDGGWIGEELTDPSARPKTSRQVLGMLSKNFALFQVKMRDLLAGGQHRDGDYGFRTGEQP